MSKAGLSYHREMMKGLKEARAVVKGEKSPSHVTITGSMGNPQRSALGVAFMQHVFDEAAKRGEPVNVRISIEFPLAAAKAKKRKRRSP